MQINLGQGVVAIAALFAVQACANTSPRQTPQGSARSPAKTAVKAPVKPASAATTSDAGASTVTGPVSSLDSLVRRHKLSYQPTPKYSAIAAPPNPVWSYVHAVKSATQPLEVRYGAAPSSLESQLHAECADNTSCQRAPSDLAVQRMLKAAVANLAKGGKAKRVKPFPMDAVRKEFNAHWGGVALFEPKSELTSNKQALAVVIYRHGRGAAMFMALYDVHTRLLGDEWMRAFHSLRFSESMADSRSVGHGKSLIDTRWRCSDFVRMSFTQTTWQVIHISVAMATMGRKQAYERIYSNVTYLPNGAFKATTFRVDNMERGDRTPAKPKPRTFTFTRSGKTLSVVGAGGKPKWTCKQ